VARQQAEELEHLRGEMQRLGVLDAVELRREADGLRGEIEAMRRDYAEQKALLDSELADLRLRVAVTQEEEILQEVGVYTYRHPLNDSVAYREQLKVLQDQIKATARRDGGAIEATTGWQVNGSAAQGRKMVNDFSKLTLRAYNAEADNLSRGMKPYKLATAIDRLEKVAVTIERLGKTMAIRVSPEYHRLRIKELELAADYQEMLAGRRTENARSESSCARSGSSSWRSNGSESGCIKSSSTTPTPWRPWRPRATSRARHGCASSSATSLRPSRTSTTELPIRSRAPPT
jgi:hypothetical protein